MAKNKSAAPEGGTTAPEENITGSEETIMGQDGTITQPEGAATPSEGSPASDGNMPGAGGGADAASGFCAYLGPTIPGTICAGTIYGLGKSAAAATPELAAAIRRYPAIEGLVVPGGELGIGNIDVTTPGTLLYCRYQKLAGELNMSGGTT